MPGWILCLLIRQGHGERQLIGEGESGYQFRVQVFSKHWLR